MATSSESSTRQETPLARRSTSSRALTTNFIHLSSEPESGDDDDHSNFEDGSSTGEDGEQEIEETPPSTAEQRLRQARRETSLKTKVIPNLPHWTEKSPYASLTGRVTSTSDTLSSSVGLRTPSESPGPSSGPILKSRRNIVSGRERVVLEMARIRITHFTLFVDPFPSTIKLTEVIHEVWMEAERHFASRVQISAESVNQVSE